MRAFVALLLALTALAGCAKDGHAPPAFAFDGEGAHDYVRLLVENASGAPRPRVPGTPGHAEGARVLHDAMAATGWAVRWQNFTGADYEALDKDGVESYHRSPAHCQDLDRGQLAALPFHNLVATWPGPGERTMWLGAHWDSKEEASLDPRPERRAEPVLGANDGASGVGVLLQLMAHVAAGEVEVPFGLGVVLFDGEDGFEDCHPLAGSLHFVSRLAPGEADRFLLLDMVGDPAARFVREGHSQKSDPALVDLLVRHAPDAGLADNFPAVFRTVADDHLPFVEAGIPAADLIDFGRPSGLGMTGFPPYWHTADDTLDKVDAGMLGRVGDLVVRVLSDPAFTRDWPAGAAGAP